MHQVLRRTKLEVLRSVYATFTEGFDTANLVDARGVLDEGSGPPNGS